MSWTEIKGAVNSTLGGANFQPLDKIFLREKEIAFSDDELFKIVDTPGTRAEANGSFKFNIPYNGFCTLKITFTALDESNYALWVTINGQEYARTKNTNGNLTYSFSCRESDVIAINWNRRTALDYVGINGKLVDVPQITASAFMLDGVEYVKRGNGLAVVGVDDMKAGADIILKERIGGMPVTAIADEAFAGLIVVSNVFLPRTLTKIGTDAFAECTNLNTLYLPRSLKEIGTNAFTGCSSLKDLYVPWSSGDVAGAPWGNSGLNIHYNTAEGVL